MEQNNASTVHFITLPYQNAASIKKQTNQK